MSQLGETYSFEDARLDGLIEEAQAWLVDQQADDGHLAFELEADATIPAEYILLNHYLDRVDDETEHKLAAYLRKTQGSHGGWPLYHGGDFNISASVKAYFALKLTGEDPDAPHMTWARKAILDHGGGAAIASAVMTYIKQPKIEYVIKPHVNVNPTKLERYYSTNGHI